MREMFTGGVPQDPSTTGVSFSDLGLSEPIVESLTGIGFEHPTPIQHEVIPKALEGLDIVGLAQTGSGKTGAFGLPMAERLIHGKGLRGLILCPTREIALQTQSFLEVVGRDHELETVCLIGGVKMGPQITGLRKHPDIVVATPGRLWDHFERKNLRLDKIAHLVLDEADHMLDLGFLPQIQRVLEVVPADRQTMMFSATMPTTIENLARRFMSSPVIVDLRPKYRMAEGIDHRLYMVEPENTRACLLAIAAEEKGSMLVFLRRKIDVDWACRQLEVEGHPVEKIHSSRTQKQRVEALQGLREGEHRILIATDIAARGIDIPIIEHIVNYGMPDSVEDYIHRAGRTARGAMGGTVSTIATWKDREDIRSVEKAIGLALPRCVAEGVEPYVERKTTIRGRKKIRRRLT
jgi:ATP-dependent RNA helicase RhlE